MTTAPFPPTLQAFVAEHISSVGELELLLLLRDDPGRTWTPHDAAARLHHVPEWVAERLERFCRQRLAVRPAGGVPPTGSHRATAAG